MYQFCIDFLLNNLFSFCMQHFHKERLGRCTASAMFHVQMLFTSRCHHMNFWYNTEQFTEFILKTKIFKSQR